MIYTLEIKTRNYEQDSSLHINNANYLRYIEEARVKMMEEKQFPLDWVYKENIQMVVYKFICNYKKQVRFPEKLVIKSKQIETKKVRGILRQEIFNEKKELCFSADAYWAYSTQDKQKLPKTVEYAKLFGYPSIDSIPRFEKNPFEFESITDNKKFNLVPLEVRPYELDSFQHVNNSVYANYFEIGRWKFREEVFGDINHFKKKKNIFVLYKTEINFLQPCFNFEKLELRTYLIKASPLRIVFAQVLTNADGQLKTNCISEGCILTEAGNPIKFETEDLEKYQTRLAI